jgi:hypothetical protein
LLVPFSEWSLSVHLCLGKHYKTGLHRVIQIIIIE